MTPMSSSSPGQMVPVSGGTHESVSGAASTVSGSESSFEVITNTATIATNTAVAVVVQGDAFGTMSTFDRHLTITLQHTFEWLYLLLLLLALLYLIYRLRKWMRERDEKMKARRLR